jgi:putative peptide zinc metalloprotease protein
MEQAKALFSESWHRVANVRIHLQPAIDIERQFYRGELWHVVHNRFNNEFFRLPPAAYHFLMRLESGTVEEVWQQSLAADHEAAPTQDEVIHLLGQLYQANLLRSTLPANTTELFARGEKRRTRELRARWLNILSFQIPLWDPDPMLTRLRWLGRLIFSKAGALVWVIVLTLGAKSALEHWPALQKNSEGVLAPGNLPLLYLALFCIKGIHEFGHALACRRFGGEVHKLGVMLIFLSPVPFVDASSSWAFRSKWKRILVAAAGMLVELFVASLAVLLWASTGPGAVHSLAYNVIFIASVTTLFFNLNPLLRYDGYYILSDLIEIPNLAARANAFLQYVAERRLFGLPQTNPARDRREGFILAAYGILSWLYRIVLFFATSIFLAKHYLLLGLVMALVCVWTLLGTPLVRLVQYLARSPRLGARRQRAVGVTVGLAAALLLIVGALPFPHHFRAPGVVEAEHWSEVVAQTNGFLREVRQRSGATVRQGDVLVVLQNGELELELKAAAEEARACQIALDRALGSRQQEILALQDRLKALQKRTAYLSAQQDELTVKAPQDGVWAAANLDQMLGNWVRRGMTIGKLLDQHAFEFSAVVPQTEAAHLFSKSITRAEVRLTGCEELALPVGAMQMIPANREHLPSAAVGWLGGGDVAVTPNDPKGLKPQESFFELRGRVAGPPTELRHGRSGHIRFTLPPEPLHRQWQRKVRQLFQRQFQD